MTCLGTEILLNRVLPNKLTPKLFGTVISINNDLINAKFIEVERQSRLLNGCFFAFLVLAIGSLMAQFGFVGYIGLFVGLVVAVMCPIIARHLQSQFVQRLANL